MIDVNAHGCDGSKWSEGKEGMMRRDEMMILMKGDSVWSAMNERGFDVAARFALPKSTSDRTAGSQRLQRFPRGHVRGERNAKVPIVVSVGLMDVERTLMSASTLQMIGVVVVC